MAADLVENPSWGVKTPWDPFSPQEGVERSAPLLGDFRVIVCLTPPQMNDSCDLLGAPYAPVSKIAPLIVITARLKSDAICIMKWLSCQKILNKSGKRNNCIDIQGETRCCHMIFFYIILKSGK